MKVKLVLKSKKLETEYTTDTGYMEIELPKDLILSDIEEYKLEDLIKEILVHEQNLHSLSKGNTERSQA